MADPGLQRLRHASAWPHVRPCLESAWRAGDHRRRDLGRYRLGGDEGHDRDAIDVFILFEGRVSPVQRRQ